MPLIQNKHVLKILLNVLMKEQGTCNQGETKTTNLYEVKKC